MIHDVPRTFAYRGHWLGHRTGSSRWYIFWWDHDAARVLRRSTGTADLEAAKEALIVFAGRHDSGRVGEPDWLELKVACALYARHVKGRPSHADTCAVHKRLLAFAATRHIRFTDQFNLIAQDHYIAWRRAEWRRHGRTGSNATINKDLEVVRATFRHAWKCGRINHLPPVELLPAPRAKDRVLSAAECQRLIQAAEQPHIRLFIKLALFTLQRRSALLELTCDQVDLVAGLIDFNPPGQLITAKRRAVVPIADGIWADLAHAVQESQSGFIIEYQGGPVQSVKKGLATAARRAGLEPLGANVLRRTAATLLAGAGVSMREISGMLGHSQVRTTERYAQHQPGYLERVGKALGEMLC